MKIPMLNCWVVAMWLWVMSRARHAAWVRRSRSFSGMVAHFGTIEHTRGREYATIEYIPPKSELWTRRNILIAFRGRYKVTVFRAARVRHFERYEDMREYVESLRVKNDAVDVNPDRH